jgi:porphobilinogen synthase
MAGMQDGAAFPFGRPRRLRRGPVLRDALADVTLRAADLILPLFVTDGDTPRPVASMPGVSQLPVPQAAALVAELAGRGLRQFIFFGVTPDDKKDAAGSYAWAPQAPVNRALAAVRDAGLSADVVTYADLCFCEYTDHGHCGVLRAPAPVQPRVERSETRASPPFPEVDNDRTLENLGRAAVAQARAGADVVAPSGMMDGQVGAIRAALDAAGFPHVAILAYSVKYASALYGPFREAGAGGMKFGDRRGYQMDYRRRREWRTELAADLAQGADMVMVKPAATYLDIVYQVRQACAVPLAAYHVSGEYAMLQAAAQRGWIDLQQATLETLYAIKRAGADLIITYSAPQVLDALGA